MLSTAAYLFFGHLKRELRVFFVDLPVVVQIERRQWPELTPQRRHLLFQLFLLSFQPCLLARLPPPEPAAVRRRIRRHAPTHHEGHRAERSRCKRREHGVGGRSYELNGLCQDEDLGQKKCLDELELDECRAARRR